MFSSDGPALNAGSTASAVLAAISTANNTMRYLFISIFSFALGAGISSPFCGSCLHTGYRVDSTTICNPIASGSECEREFGRRFGVCGYDCRCGRGIVKCNGDRAGAFAQEAIAVAYRYNHLIITTVAIFVN